MFGRYNEFTESCRVKSLVRAGVCFMKFRAFLLSVILAAGVSLPTLASAQADPKKTPPTERDQSQPASQTHPTDQTQPANQTQPAKANDSQPADKSAPADQSADQVKHSGGKDDVDAIGNRKIGGVDWYSIEKEVRMGKEYAMQIEQSMKMVQDPVVTEYINRIGHNLVRNSDAKVPFTIKVVDSDEVNAFALPGAFFYVDSGWIMAADEEAELAGVRGPEIGHVAPRPYTRRGTKSTILQWGTIPLILLGPGGW